MSNLSVSNSYNIANALAQFDIELAAINSTSLVNDSRKVTSGSVFCATQGVQADGRQYIDAAIAAGAVLIIAQCKHVQQHGNIITHAPSAVDATRSNKVQIVQFYKLNENLAQLASHYYNQPSEQLTLVGITGTNGKTSTSQMIAGLIEGLGKSTAVIGTTGAGKINKLSPIVNTTPGATELNQLLSEFVSESVKLVAMEVSSHALDQGRIKAEQLAIAVFTNLSRDHLDYHQTMENYAEAKRAIFSGSNEQIAVINGDDIQAQAWLPKLTKAQPTIVYGFDTSISQYPRFVRATDIIQNQRGVAFTLVTEQQQVDITSPLLGRFNIANLLAAIAVTMSQGFALKDIAKQVSQLRPSYGRMECYSQDNKATSVVDYAHTPDALDNALTACRQHCDGDLWLVFGCGGDRDKGKRSLMGQVAENRADHIVITNDNPRTEAPEMIANDILSGCQHPEKITVILDRKQAVTSTIAHAKENDLVLLAGKGHEANIQIGEQTINYNERELVSSLYLEGVSA